MGRQVVGSVEVLEVMQDVATLQTVLMRLLNVVCREMWRVGPTGGQRDGGAAYHAGGCHAEGCAAALPRLLALGHRLVARIHELSDLPWYPPPTPLSR